MGGELSVHGMYGNSILQFSLLQNECVFSICKLFFKRKLILIPVRFLVEVNFRILIKRDTSRFAFHKISFSVSQRFWKLYYSQPCKHNSPQSYLRAIIQSCALNFTQHRSILLSKPENMYKKQNFHPESETRILFSHKSILLL